MPCDSIPTRFGIKMSIYFNTISVIHTISSRENYKFRVIVLKTIWILKVKIG